ncbi:hypothetical protein [Streptomyces sp. NPDC001450]
MDHTTAPKRQTLTTADAALWVQHDRANALAEVVDAIRAWRYAQPDSDGDGVEFATLDVILSAAVIVGDAPLQRLQRPATVVEACDAHREVMAARARAFEALRLVWDQIEGASIRAIAAAPQAPKGS